MGLRDRIKKALGIALVAGTMAGASGQAIASQEKILDPNNQTIEELETDSDFINKYYGLKPVVDLMIAETAEYHRGEEIAKRSQKPELWWSESLNKEYYSILGQRKSICDTIKGHEEEQNKKLILSSEREEDIRKLVESNSEQELKSMLSSKIEGLINKNLISLDSANDRLRIELLQDKVDSLDFSGMSTEDIVKRVGQLENEIIKAREILKAKRTLIQGNKQYSSLQQQLEDINEQIDAEKWRRGKGRLSPTRPELAALLQKKGIIRANMQLEESKVENNAVNMVYSREQTQGKDSFIETLKYNVNEREAIEQTEQTEQQKQRNQDMEQEL